MGFPGGTSGKEPSCQCRRCKRLEFDCWVGKIFWRSFESLLRSVWGLFSSFSLSFFSIIRLNQDYFLCVSSDKMVRVLISLPVGISTMFISQRAKLLRLCLTFCNSMDCRLPVSSVHGILQARILLLGIFPTQESNPCLLHWQVAF